MRNVAIHKATRHLGPPLGVGSEDCGRLLIRDVPGRLGNDMWSAWEPTPHELAILNQGGRVYLAVAGTSHPPVMVAVGHHLLAEDAEEQSA